MDQQPPGFFKSFLYFLRHNLWWWLVPILIVLGLLVFLILTRGNDATTPFYKIE